MVSAAISARCHGFHLDAGTVDCLNLRLDFDKIVSEGEVHIDRADQHGMTERNEVWSAFGGLNARDPAAPRTSPLLMALLAILAV